jgi:hypothetical protein
MRRTAILTLSAATTTALLVPLTVSPSAAGPPGIPTVIEAQYELAAIPIADESHTSTYDRTLFPHWITIAGSCNTREQVLKRDGANVVVNSSCAAVSGSWYSPYDGATWTAPSDVDIDHMVPLSEAWASGAWSWTTSRRQQFANDLAGPQLWAVTDNINQSKGDKDPAEWKPPMESFYCEYAKSWIDVKHDWGLSMQASERDALAEMLATC